MSSTSEGLNSAVIFTIVAIICATSIAANILVIIIMILKKGKHTVTEVFLCNLAISDVVLAGVAIPLKLHQARQEGGNFTGGIGYCKLLMTLPLLSIASSILTMVAVSFERYRSIVHQRYLSARHLYITIGLIWFLSVILAAPQLYEYSVVQENETHGNITEIEIICGSVESSHVFPTTYGSIVVFCVYVIPSLVILINYFRMGRFVWMVSKGQPGRGTQFQGSVAKNKVTVVKQLALATFVFIILWAPFFVLFFLEEVTGNDDTGNSSSLANSAKQTMVALSTTSNPIIYALFNKKFRKDAAHVLSCRSGTVAATGTSTAHSNSENNRRY